jgi:adenine deaminase
MATLNTAEHFGVARDLGQIAPGRFADILLVSDLHDFQAEVVVSKGCVIAQNGELLIDLPSYPYPDWAIQSVHLGKKLTVEDFKLSVNGNQSSITANVIGVIENQAPTKHLRMDVNVQNDEVAIDLERDILKIAIVERHKGTGTVMVGLVHGFGFSGRCAIATTVAHDSHHMIVVGTDETQMAMAANRLGEVGGGQVVFKEGEVLGQVELPIAGLMSNERAEIVAEKAATVLDGFQACLMSNERAEIVAEKAATVLDGFQACGCTLNNPNMQLSLLALVVIPELRISDLGLVDVTKFDFVPVIEKHD